ncbi:MAG: hypothetical protein K6F43_03690 [Prevotella sp.]|nr:hypothetical protein [Prevotella sp.]
MKKWILLTAICSLPLSMMAQDDDMYFVPTKENVAKETKNYGMPKNTYYSGSNRSVDDYNGRLSSSVTPIDSVGQVVETDDYKYTRQLSRFDDYTPSQAYWEGYRDGRWSSPWYYGRYGWYSTWYDPWYSSWYDPWYDSWYYGSYGYYGWTSPWRYGWYGSYYRPWGYYGYYTPIYYYSGHYRPAARTRFHANRNVSGSSAFGNGFGRANGGRSNGGFGNSRSNNNRTTSSSNDGFGRSRSNSTGFGSNSRSSSSSNSSFGSSRSSSSSSSSRGSFGGGGGGSRSGGGGGRFGR